MVIVLLIPRCATLPLSNLCSWRRDCGIRRSLLSTQPSQRPFQSDPWPCWSTRTWWLRGNSKASCRADRVYRWSTAAEVEAHCFNNQSPRWEKKGKFLCLLLFYFHINSSLNKPLFSLLGKDFLFVFGGKNESEAALGGGHFLCLDRWHWTEVC